MNPTVGRSDDRPKRSSGRVSIDKPVIQLTKKEKTSRAQPIETEEKLTKESDRASASAYPSITLSIHLLPPFVKLSSEKLSKYVCDVQKIPRRASQVDVAATLTTAIQAASSLYQRLSVHRTTLYDFWMSSKEASTSLDVTSDLFLKFLFVNFTSFAETLHSACLQLDTAFHRRVSTQINVADTESSQSITFLEPDYWPSTDIEHEDLCSSILSALYDHLSTCEKEHQRQLSSTTTANLVFLPFLYTIVSTLLHYKSSFNHFLYDYALDADDNLVSYAHFYATVPENAAILTQYALLKKDIVTEFIRKAVDRGEYIDSKVDLRKRKYRNETKRRGRKPKRKYATEDSAQSNEDEEKEEEEEDEEEEEEEENEDEDDDDDTEEEEEKESDDDDKHDTLGPENDENKDDNQRPFAKHDVEHDSDQNPSVMMLDAIKESIQVNDSTSLDSLATNQWITSEDPQSTLSMQEYEENEQLNGDSLPVASSNDKHHSLDEIQKEPSSLSSTSLRLSQLSLPERIRKLVKFKDAAVANDKSLSHHDYLLREMKMVHTHFRQKQRYRQSSHKRVCLALKRASKRVASSSVSKKETLRAKNLAKQVGFYIRKFWYKIERLLMHQCVLQRQRQEKLTMKEQLDVLVNATEQFTHGLAHRLKGEELERKQEEKEEEKEEMISDTESRLIDIQKETEEENDTQNDPGHHDPLFSCESESDDESTLSQEEALLHSEHQNCLHSDNELDELANDQALSIEDLVRKYYGETVTETVHPEKEIPLSNPQTSMPTPNPPSTPSLLDSAARQASECQPVSDNQLSSTHTIQTTPQLLKHTLREYQLVGVNWLLSMHDHGLNGILADEMGLGKTIQTIALLAYLAGERGQWGPHLIVVPNSVLLNWDMEFKTWCPAMRVVPYYGTPEERRAKRRAGFRFPFICVTSYRLAMRDAGILKRIKWHYLILDEAQSIKNYRSRRWQTLLQYPSQRRLLLTGTPLQNHLIELWALMHFLMPAVFASSGDFQQWFNAPLLAAIEERGLEIDTKSHRILERLHGVLRPFLLRRLKRTVAQQLPNKYEHVVKCRLSNRQRYLYDEFMSRAQTKEVLQRGQSLGVLSCLMQLRKVCNHPNLFEARPVQSPLLLRPVSMTHERDARLYTGHLLQLHENKINQRGGIGCCPMPYYAVQSLREAQRENQSRRGLYRMLQRSIEKEAESDKGMMDAKEEEKKVHPSIGIHVHPSYHHYDDKDRFDTQKRNNVEQQQIKRSAELLEVNERRLNHESERHRDFPECLYHLLTPRITMPWILEHDQEEKKDDERDAEIKKEEEGILKEDEEKGNTQSNGTLPKKRKQSEKNKVSLQPMEEKLPNKETVDTLSPPDSVTENKTDDPSENRNIKETTLSQSISIKQENDPSIPSVPPPPPRPPRKKLTKENAAAHFMKRFPNRFPVLARQQHTALRRASLLKTRTETASAFSLLVSDNVTPVAKQFQMALPAVETRRHLAPFQSCWIKEDMLHDHRLSSAPYSLFPPLLFPDHRLIEYDCGKLQVLARLLADLKRDRHRCLIFTQMAKMLDILESFLSHHGHRYLRLDGATPIDTRQRAVERFNQDEKVFCFILSTRSGGLGLNLTGADTVIFYDSDWNPAMDAQAQDRAHRIGQTRDVHIYRLISEHTVEETILLKAQQKRQLDDMVFRQGQFTATQLMSDGSKTVKEEENASDLTAAASLFSWRDLLLHEEEDGGKESRLASLLFRKTETKENLTEPLLEEAMVAVEDAEDASAYQQALKEKKEEEEDDDENEEENEEKEEDKKEKNQKKKPLLNKSMPSSSSFSAVHSELSSSSDDEMEASNREMEAMLLPVQKYALRWLESQSRRWLTAIAQGDIQGGPRFLLREKKRFDDVE